MVFVKWRAQTWSVVVAWVSGLLLLPLLLLLGKSLLVVVDGAGGWASWRCRPGDESEEDAEEAGGSEEEDPACRRSRSGRREREMSKSVMVSPVLERCVPRMCRFGFGGSEACWTSRVARAVGCERKGAWVVVVVLWSTLVVELGIA
jgi:hypothetical protein